MNVLEIYDYNVSIENNDLFHVDDLVIKQGEKIAFIGENGIGKTTFFKHIVSKSIPRMTLNGNIAYLPQLLESDNLSGGEKEKSELSKLLISDNQILILDEPTTNLDFNNRKWLIDYLVKTKKTVLLITHDRFLINQVVQKILYLDSGELKTYKGNLKDFEEFRQQQFNKMMLSFDNQRKKQKKLKEEAQRKKQYAISMVKKKKGISYSDWKTRNYDGKARKLDKVARSIETRIDRENTIEKPKKEKKIKIKNSGELSLKSGKTLINIEKFSLSIVSSLKIKINNFIIRTGEHIGIEGDNGSGKTQFLNKIYELKDNHNYYYYYDKLSIGYFRQNLTLFEDNDIIINSIMAESKQDYQTIYDTLGSFGLKADEIRRTYKQLSGGQRVRANLAKVLLGNHNLLLLDEPNNHLDISSIEALENFLIHYPGAVILVSHDKNLINSVCSKIYIMEKFILSSKETKSSNYSNVNQSQITELEFKRSILLSDPTIDLEQIKEIDAKIRDLKNSSSVLHPQKLDN
ncbi:ATP-binding cassette domain-containing protein [Streptococcus sp. 2106]|uniref:ATP-binding cassette domain-containing protein n=1 Tax=Streptococcus sp. 2106 TaxID=2582642 RepID=UPI0015629994|nr:ATP-binding cassette domain-containing protein [Streptococcus sp. 2106]